MGMFMCRWRCSNTLTTVSGVMAGLSALRTKPGLLCWRWRGCCSRGGGSCSLLLLGRQWYKRLRADFVSVLFIAVLSDVAVEVPLPFK